MKPSAFVTSIAEQLHYQLSSALQDYLSNINTIYKRTGSFLGTKTETEVRCSTATANLSVDDLEFLQFSEKEYRAREEMLIESRCKRTQIVIGDMYWNALISIRDGNIAKKATITTPQIEMKTSSSQIQLSTALDKLLKLKYITLSKTGDFILTKKGTSLIAKLDTQHNKIENVTVESKQSILNNHYEIDLANQGDNDCSLRLILDCRGESAYAKMLHPDIAQYISIAKLPHGDCLILKNNHPVTLVERKTISDLSASFYDGRIQRQLSSPTKCPTFLLVEDPQLLLVHEKQLFQAVLDEIDKNNVLSVIQSTSAEHTARIYGDLFRNARDFSQCQSLCCALDNDEYDSLSNRYHNSSNDWYYFIKNLLVNYSQNIIETVVTTYPNYTSLAVETPSTVQQRLLTMGMPRSAVYSIIELISY